MTLLYTCLPANEILIRAGFSTVVAAESDRIPLAAFQNGEDATAWCDQQNKSGKRSENPVNPVFVQTDLHSTRSDPDNPIKKTQDNLEAKKLESSQMLQIESELSRQIQSEKPNQPDTTEHDPSRKGEAITSQIDHFKKEEPTKTDDPSKRIDPSKPVQPAPQELAKPEEEQEKPEFKQEEQPKPGSDILSKGTSVADPGKPTTPKAPEKVVTATHAVKPEDAKPANPVKQPVPPKPPVTPPKK